MVKETEVSLDIPVTYGERMQSMGWTAPLGIAIISGVDETALQQALAAVSNPAADLQQDSPVLSRIQAFDKFFIASCLSDLPSLACSTDFFKISIVSSYTFNGTGNG